MDKKNIQDSCKINAAREAVKLVTNEMTLGLGTGSTANFFIKILAERCKNENLKLKCVCTSNETKFLAEKLGLLIVDIDKIEKIDITVDGTDEFDKFKNLIKGGGGALLKEKIVAYNSKKMVIIADETKSKDILGQFPLPVEIVRFGSSRISKKIYEALKFLEYKDFKISFRMSNEKNFITDEGHYILDLFLSEIKNPTKLHRELILIPGVVETGLFLNMANKIIVGTSDGETLSIG